jgi:hypothetical protein
MKTPFIMVVVQDIRKKGLNSAIAWMFALCLIEVCLLWGLASQFSYLVYVKSDTSGTHLFLVLGLILTASVAVVTVGFTAARASEAWLNQRCRKIFGMDARLMYKTEVLALSLVILGTLIGTGVWDIVTTFNALIDSGWDTAVFYDDYLVFDMLIFEIVWPLWLHTTVGGIKIIIGVVIAGIIGSRVSKGTFCEM